MGISHISSVNQAMASALLGLLLLALSLGVLAMPYQVPLQGREGGKRTLVVLDSLGEGNAFSLFFEDLESR